MAINGINRQFDVVGIVEGALNRTRERAATRWPWPQPFDSVLATLDGDASASGLLVALGDAGLGDAEVWTLSGEEGARDLREVLDRRGALARLRGVLDGDDELTGHLEAWCARGGTIAIVRPPRERADAAVDAIARQGAGLIRHSGLWMSRTNTDRGARTASRVD